MSDFTLADEGRELPNRRLGFVPGRAIPGQDWWDTEIRFGKDMMWAADKGDQTVAIEIYRGNYGDYPLRYGVLA